jgi:hypothetical protein
MKRIAFFATMLSAACLAGCPAEPGSSDPTAPRTGNEGFFTNPFRTNANGQNGGGKTPSYHFVVSLRITTIEVPVGTASGSEEIWSYLDEEPIHAIRSANLGRNGLRVGLGRLGTWPDVARILKRMTGRSPKRNLVACIPGNPLPIILKERQADQTIFTFHDDRTLSGRDYPAGDYLLAIVCTLDEDDPSKIILTAMPQVRTTRRQRRFVMRDAGPEMVAHAEVFGLSHLTFQLMMGKESFLVIGPGANSRNPTSVGHHFLVKKKEGMEFETLLVLIPKVLAAPVR